MGAFLIVGAVLIHVMLVGRFAETVPDEDTRTRSVAVDATVLDPSTGKVDTGVRLERTRSVAGAGSPAPDLDTYVVSTSVQRTDGTFVARERWSAVQQPVAGRAVDSAFNSELVTRFDANGNSVESRRPLRSLEGVLLRFGRDTRPVDQLRWDPSTGTAGVAEFVGRSTLAGREVLEFRQRGEGRSASASGEVSAASETTLWVRPETGAVVRERLRVVNRLPDGTVALDATFDDVAADVREASRKVDDAVGRRTRTTVAAPAVILVLGIVVLVVAGLEGRSGRVSGRVRRTRSMEDA